jgi:hypothetical protein
MWIKPEQSQYRFQCIRYYVCIEINSSIHHNFILHLTEEVCYLKAFLIIAVFTELTFVSCVY